MGVQKSEPITLISLPSFSYKTPFIAQFVAKKGHILQMGGSYIPLPVIGILLENQYSLLVYSHIIFHKMFNS